MRPVGGEEADRQAYAAAYARPGRMRAGWAYFVSFLQAAKDFGELSRNRLTMPVLAIGGDKASGEFLGEQMSWSRMTFAWSSSRTPAIG
ncbi:MAG TPA: hypothetical protein VGL03_04600 [Thermoanaerobaculia bacterium]